MSDALSGRIVTETGVVEGTLRFGSLIDAIEPGSADETIIVPGFVDLHVHGGGGADVMEGADAVRTMSRLHGRHGTTSLLATTMTAPPDEVIAALTGIADAMANAEPDAADILGAHLEGPFISPNKLGAQPPAALGPDLALLLRLLDICPIKVATVAPDMGSDAPIEPALMSALFRALIDHGARVQLGHSPCSYETAVDAFGKGATGVTHLFNAMIQ